MSSSLCVFISFNSIFKDMKWIEEKQALYRRNQELVEKVSPEPLETLAGLALCSWGAAVVPAGLKGGARAEASEWLCPRPLLLCSLLWDPVRSPGEDDGLDRGSWGLFSGVRAGLSAAASPFVSCCADGSVGRLVRAS